MTGGHSTDPTGRHGLTPWAAFCVAAAVGLAAVAAPLPTGPSALAVIVVLLLALVSPAMLLQLALLVLIVSPQYFVAPGFRIAGLELSTLQNLLIIVLAAPVIVHRGLRRWVNPVVLAGGVLLVVTFTLSSRHPDLSGVQPFRSFAAMILGPLLFELQLRRGEAWRTLQVAALLPVSSLALGLVLQSVGVWNVLRSSLGVVRLGGATIPAHLAVLGVVGVLASLLLAARRPWFLALASVNLMLVVLSGTRAPIAVSSLLVVAHVYRELRPALRNRPFLPVGSAVLAVTLVIASIVYGPTLVQRFGDNPYEAASLNTSGRLVAWQFFLDVAEEDIWFGRGLGAATVANQGQVHRAFRVPHNDYLRCLVDGGVVGLMVVVLAFVAMFRDAYRRVTREQRLLVLASAAVLALIAVVGNPLSTQQFSVPFWVCLGCAARLAAGSGGDSLPKAR